MVCREEVIKGALWQYRRHVLLHRTSMPYDANPVVALRQRCTPAAVPGLFRLYQGLGVAGVYRNWQMVIVGREANAERAAAMTKRCHGEGAGLDRLARWCLQSHVWDVPPSAAELRDYIRADKVQQRVRELFPKLRKRQGGLRTHGGHYRLGGILPVKESSET